jgi:hypothetical protein
MARVIFGILILPALAVAAVQAKPLRPSQRTPAQSIVDELESIPRPGQFGFQDAPLPPFSAKTLEAYQADYKSLEELKTRIRTDPAKHPMRTAVLKAIDVLRQSSQWDVDRVIPAPTGPRQKAVVLKKQKKLGADLFYLEKALEELQAAAANRAQEPSRRWQAHYDYVLAVFQARIVFAYEYQFLLGRFRREEMPPLVPGQTGWRLGPRQSLQIIEGKVQRLSKEVDGRWPRIERDYPGTPWDAFAQRERVSQRGLQWLPGLEAD